MSIEELIKKKNAGDEETLGDFAKEIRKYTFKQGVIEEVDNHGAVLTKDCSFFEAMCQLMEVL